MRADPQRARLDLRAAHTGPILLPRLLSRGPRSARIALVAGGALLLAGDHLTVEIDVGDDCLLELSEVAGTVAYDADGRESSLSVSIRLGRRARLLWMGLELVVADGASTRRSIDVHLDDDAVALIRDTTVLGRTGERGGHVLATARYTMAGHTGAGTPLLVESLELRGEQPVPGVVDGNRVIDSVVLAGRRPQDPMGAFELDRPGALARYLGVEAHRSPLAGVWEVWRSELLSSADLTTEELTPVRLR